PLLPSLLIPSPLSSTLFPYTTLFRSIPRCPDVVFVQTDVAIALGPDQIDEGAPDQGHQHLAADVLAEHAALLQRAALAHDGAQRLAPGGPALLTAVRPVVLQFEPAVDVRLLPGVADPALRPLVEHLPALSMQVQIGIQASVDQYLEFAEQLVDQQLLAREIPVDGAGADPGLLGYQGHGYSVDPAFGEQLEGGTEYGAALVPDPWPVTLGGGGLRGVGGRGMIVHCRILAAVALRLTGL